MASVIDTGRTFECIPAYAAFTRPFSREDAVKGVGTLIFIVYFLLIFEGVFRKWILPSFQRELFFLRDPFLLAIYIRCFRYNIWPRERLWTISALAWMWLGGALVVIQVAIGMIATRTSLLFAIYGWREYFLYIPLAFVIGECFSRNDLMRLVRYTLLLAIPIGLLVLLQCHSNAHAWINAGTSDNPANLFIPLGVALGYVRPEGTFSSVLGQALYVGSAIAMLVWVWVVPAELRPVRGAMLLAATVGVVTCLAAGGQRMEFLFAGSIALGALVSAAWSETYIARRTLRLTAGLLLVGTVFASLLFGKQLHALGVRAAGAAEEDSTYSYGIVNRTVNDLLHFTSFLGTTPLTGYGIASTENATDTLGITTPVSVEDDLSRNVVELGPVLGLAFILFRVWLVFWLLARAVRSVNTHSDLLPLLLIAFIGPALLYTDIGQGTENGYVWMFAGFCIAASGSGNCEIPACE